MVKRLRIAAIAICLVGCLALTAAWVRSYSRIDVMCWGITPHRGIMAKSSAGLLVIDYVHSFGESKQSPIPSKRRTIDWDPSFAQRSRIVEVQLSKWFVISSPVGDAFVAWFVRDPVNMFGGFGLGKRNGVVISLPYWFAILSLGVMGAALYFRRFSIRALLVAVTVVAVVLGVMLASNPTGATVYKVF
jgi:hypothetical protein